MASVAADPAADLDAVRNPSPVLHAALAPTGVARLHGAGSLQATRRHAVRAPQASPAHSLVFMRRYRLGRRLHRSPLEKLVFGDLLTDLGRRARIQGGHF